MAETTEDIPANFPLPSEAIMRQVALLWKLRSVPSGLLLLGGMAGSPVYGHDNGVVALVRLECELLHGLEVLALQLLHLHEWAEGVRGECERVRPAYSRGVHARAHVTCNSDRRCPNRDTSTFFSDQLDQHTLPAFPNVADHRLQ